jgi:transcriptional regulator of acetoin/glycerol metabolism
MNKPVEGVEPLAMEMLMNYVWPGNVRELENAIERAMVVTKNKTLSVEDFNLNYGQVKVDYHNDLSIDNVEKQHILRVLEKNNWNISRSAKVLGIDRVTVYKKMQKYGIERPSND